jgi:hypothetical protein
MPLFERELRFAQKLTVYYRFALSTSDFLLHVALLPNQCTTSSGRAVDKKNVRGIER